MRRFEKRAERVEIGACQLSSLSKIGGALDVKTKRLYDEVDDKKSGRDEI